MGYLDTYRKKMNAQNGIIQTSKHTVNNNFSNSLFSEVVLIDGVEYEAIITQQKNSRDKKLLLKPDTNIDIGVVVEMNNSKYLVMDFLGDGINEIYPTATLKLCNATYPLTTTTKTIVGYDDFGRPEYSSTTSTEQFPCIAENKIAQRDNDINDKAINVVDNRLWITLPYRNHDDISINKEVSILGDTYKIVNVDKTFADLTNGVGILILHAERVVNNT